MSGMSRTVHALGGSYPDLLDRAWAEHLAPRASDAPTVVSTFAGCGGSSLGYSMAGYRELLAVEWDDHAAQVFRTNFPEVPVWHGDIGELSVEKALEMAGIGVGELDVFDGSPPCQGFSFAGKRKFNDERNFLFREYCRLLRGLQPRAFVMENVSGMVKGKMRIIFAEILRELKNCGYRVKASVLKAHFYGVPQLRERIIFVGVRRDLPADPSHPEPFTLPVTFRDAVAGLPPAEEGDHLLPTGQVYNLAQLLKPWERGCDYVPGGKCFSTRRLHWLKPSPTITKTIASGFSMFLHPDGQRSVSIPEAKRLASFPDQFVLEGKFEEAWARIGNSVPPLLMRAIAAHIAENLLGKGETRAEG